MAPLPLHQLPGHPGKKCHHSHGAGAGAQNIGRSHQQHPSREGCRGLFPMRAEKPDTHNYPGETTSLAGGFSRQREMTKLSADAASSAACGMVAAAVDCSALAAGYADPERFTEAHNSEVKRQRDTFLALLTGH